MLADQTAQITLKSEGITASALRTAMQALLMKRRDAQRQGGTVHGEQSLDALNAQGRPLESVEIHSKDIQDIRRELARYAVDMSIMKEPGTDTYRIFFKSQDAERMELGLKRCVERLDLSATRTPMSEQIQSATKEANERNAAHDLEKTMERAARAVQQEATL